MKKERKDFNKRCDKKCIVHRLVTHNTCLFCKALRNSPSDIKELQQQLEKEID